MATELRDLVAQWRQSAAETKYAMYEAVYTECADALDAALTAAEGARENVSSGTTNRTAPTHFAFGDELALCGDCRPGDLVICEKPYVTCPECRAALLRPPFKYAGRFAADPYLSKTEPPPPPDLYDLLAGWALDRDDPRTLGTLLRALVDRAAREDGR